MSNSCSFLHCNFSAAGIPNPKSWNRNRYPLAGASPGRLKFAGNGVASRHSRRQFRLNASSLELPLLPFNMSEILVPSERKTLHLYEARYLALLDESLLRKKLFVHFVLDPISISKTAREASFAAKHGCLVLIENVETLDVGALVSIRGIGRVEIKNIVQAEPYWKGEVRPMKDWAFDSGIDVNSKVMQVKEALHSLNTLEIKLKAPKEAEMLTCILNSLSWAEKEPSYEFDEAFVPSSAERVSFAAFQPVTGSTQSEQLKLQEQKVKAMELKNTIQRLENSLGFAKDNISMIAAKLAIQSLGMK